MSMKERQAALNHRLKACNARLELTGDERSRSRSNPSLFWVKPGHELENERIVETGERYSVVKLEAQPFYVVSAPS